MEIVTSWEEVGFEKDEKRGKLELIIKLIKKRFGILKEKQEKQILALPIDKIDELAMALLDFKNAEELQNWLGKFRQSK
jgi:uncharacterized protein (DUF2384 family)